MAPFLRRLAPVAGLLAAVVLATPVPAVSPDAAPKKFPNDISLQRMWRDVWYLAHEDCEGRGIETKGIEKAADHIAAEFKKAGLKPAGKDGSYFQPFTVTTGGKLGTPVTFKLTGPKGEPRELELQKEFAALGFSAAGKANGPLVFAGYGITAPELKYDDYADLDVTGKIVVVLRHTPRADAEGDKRFDPAARSGVQSLHAPVSAKITNAAARGAAALVLVNDATTAAAKDFLPDFRSDIKGMDGAPFPVVAVKRDTLDAALKAVTGKSLDATEEAIDKDLKPASCALTGYKADVVVTADRTDLKVKNVVGYLEGSGPLADETVVIGAHYDHLGLGEEGRMGGKDVIGKIHHGADDNASGTAGMIELARRFAADKDRDRRRIVFVAFSGEERGLYGSVWYCRHPVFPINKTVAMINLDMIGRTTPVDADWLGVFGKRDRLMIYGTGTADSFPKLVDATTARHDFRVFTQESGYGPSDHASFYRYRVPVLFFYTGTHAEYHRPTDVADKINVEGMGKVVGLVREFAEHLATVPTRPEYRQTTGLWRDPSEPRKGGGYGARLGTQPSYNYGGEGVLLDDVTPGGPADAAGLRGGDVIIEMNGKAIKDVYAYHGLFKDLRPGKVVEMVVIRGRKRVTFQVTPE